MLKSAPSIAKTVGLLLMLATLFQGLTLLVLKSSLCDVDENPFFDQFPLRKASGTLTTNDQCEVGRSAIVSIVSMCLWFVAGCIALMVPVESVDYGDKPEGQQEMPAEDNNNNSP